MMAPLMLGTEHIDLGEPQPQGYLATANTDLGRMRKPRYRELILLL